MSVEEYWLEFDMHMDARDRMEEARGGPTRKDFEFARKLHAEKVGG